MGKSLMKRNIKALALSELIVNPSNDRHGEMPDEASAMAELLTTLPAKMKSLAKDLSKTCEVKVIAMVSPAKSGKYMVYDGNRRITCLKLLNKPQLAPTEEWQDFFSGIAAKAKGAIPTALDCQIETDQDRIDDYLYRIHTGSQDGVGQINWGNQAKSYFVERTGKSKKIDLPGIIEEKLRSENLISKSTKVKHTNVDRLLSSEEFRSRVGISVKGNKVVFIRDIDKSLNALVRIVNDLASGTLNLNHLLRNDNKRKYLNALETEGVLPTVHNQLKERVDFKTGDVTKQPVVDNASVSSPLPMSINVPKSPKRETLIRQWIDYEVPFKANIKRATDIWDELQHHLKFGKHDNAIAVLFRVLLELSIENYITCKNISSIHPNDKLSKKFRKVIDHQKENGLIDKKTHESLAKFEQKEAIFSANTMHKYVHHKAFFPSKNHLASMWDTLSELIVNCLCA